MLTHGSRAVVTSYEVQAPTSNGGNDEKSAAADPLTSVPSKLSTLLLNESRGRSEKARRYLLTDCLRLVVLLLVNVE